MSEARHGWTELSTFCLFVGYGRSGHSAIGSVIDAHPHAVIAHELNAVKRFFAGTPRDDLFREIFLMAQRQAMAGRRSSRAEGGTFLHRIDGQLKPNARGITVLGDKKGAGTTTQFAEHGLDAIDAFNAYVGLPVKMLHVVRNPYDIAAAGIARGASAFPALVPLAAAIRQRMAGDNWLDVYYEDVVANPRHEVSRILEFLGLTVLSDHLAKCEAYLYPTPHRRRFETEWPPGLRATVADLIDQFDFLARYGWET
jgi:hypothetical protein